MRGGYMKEPEFEMKCEKCGKPQRKSKKSNQNWAVFDSNAKCECGGKFAMYIDGKKIG